MVMAGAHALALAGDLLLLGFPGPLVSVATLAMIGMGYGVDQRQHGGGDRRLLGGGAVRADRGAALHRLVRRGGDAAGGGGAAVRPHRRLSGAIVIAAGANLLGMLVAAGLPAARRGAAPAPRAGG